MVVRYFSFVTKALIPSLKSIDYPVYRRIQFVGIPHVMWTR